MNIEVITKEDLRESKNEMLSETDAVRQGGVFELFEIYLAERWSSEFKPVTNYLSVIYINL